MAEAAEPVPVIMEESAKAGTLEALRADGVQIVILDEPEIYSEYAPYKYVDDLREFMNQAGNLNLVV